MWSVVLIGYRSSNHPQQVGRRGANPEVDDRATAPEVFDPLHERFGFSIDVAASQENAKCERYYTTAEDGLAQSWADERVWCNPPYSSIAPWVEKAWAETEAELVVMIVPANRTEQVWWQEMVEPYRDRAGSALRTEFVKGRLRFIRKGATEIGPNERPPFGCCLLIWEQPPMRINAHRDAHQQEAERKSRAAYYADDDPEYERQWGTL